MPLRSVILFNLGPPFGGFRLAVNPRLLGMEDHAAFPALEEAIATAFTLLAAHQPSSWPSVAQEAFAAATPCLGGREGVIDCTSNASDQETGEVVLRAFLSFPGWPLGGWAVFDAQHRTAEGIWIPFTSDELQIWW